MNLSPQAVFQAARATLADPAGAARQVMALRLTTAEGLMAVALTAALATLLTSLMQAFLGPVPDPDVQRLFSRPFVLAFSQFSVMLAGAFLMWRVGKVFGGTGTFAQGLSLVAWLEVVLILLQLAEVAVLLILPVLAMPIGLASVFAFFYLLTHFTAALNGSTSLTKTFFGILGTVIVVLLVTSFALILILPVPNV
jgi:hypothetical protein